MQNTFIAIEGNIGAGKTSLCSKLAEEFNFQLVLEQFSDNPFLPLFYEKPDQHAFAVELFFMAERYQQLQQYIKSPDLFKKGTIADYFFIKTLLFARNNLSGEEFRLFQRFFQILNAQFPKPDLLVYLHRPVSQLIKNIRKRGRSYEQEISPEYLQSIQDAYLDYFKMETGAPILVVELGDVDFINNPGMYQKIKQLLVKKYEPGVITRSLINEVI